MRRTKQLCLLAGLCAGLPAAAQSFTNGDFQTGSMSPWLVVNTPNGVGAPGTVPSIDIDGPGPLPISNAARFSVGQSVSVPGTFEGVLMRQSLSLEAGLTYQVDCDWAVLKTALPNAPDGGRFAVFVGAAVIAEDIAGTAGPFTPRYGHLSGTFTRSSSGSVSVGILITRGLAPVAGLSQYVDNVTITPGSTPLGTLPVGTTTVNGTLGPGEVRWYSFTIPTVISPAYLDIDTEGSALAPNNDTELGLYSRTGNLIATDDDDGNNVLSQLTFGNHSPRPRVGESELYDGRDGSSLAAGTYYLAVAGFNSTFGFSNWGVVSPSTHTGNFRVNLTLGNDVPTGACCAPGGGCSIVTQVTCTTAGRVYAGDGTECGPSSCPFGACCMANGTCATLLASQCTAAGGVFVAGGDCANHVCPGGFGFSKTIAGTFTDIGTTGTAIPITLGNSDGGTGPFVSSVTNALVPNPNLFASTNGFISNVAFPSSNNAPLPLAVAGLTIGLFPNWDDLFLDGPASIRHEARVENGANVEIIQWDQARTYFAGVNGPRGTFQVKIFGTGGPALVQYLYRSMAWDFNGNSSTVGVQWNATGALMRSYGTTNAAPPPPGPIPDDSVVSIVGAVACYANCDGSTVAPVLNVQDFACFLNRFAAGDTYANCDGSVTTPVLNVVDFACFLNEYAAGCS